MPKNKINLISDTVHGTIRLSEIEMEIISSPIFNRLHDISQNSTAFLTFPTNRTKRFEHSIGTMYLAGEMFRYGILNASDEDRDSFFAVLKQHIDNRMKELLNNGQNTYKINLHDKNYSVLKLKDFCDAKFIKGIHIMDEWIPHNVKQEQKYMYLALMQSVRLAGLMHDAGHPPFSHITEFAMKDMWKSIGLIEPKDRCEGQKQYYNALDIYFKNEGELHERIGNKITDRLLSSIQKPMPTEKNAYISALPIQLYRVMVKEMTSAILDEKNTFFRNIHGIISGSLDADRLDYVTRDVRNSGLDNGKIEYDRLIPRMKLIMSDDEYFFCPSIKSINVLEDFFSRRWNLYKKIVFHHRVIKTDYLLRDCVTELLKVALKENLIEQIDEKILPYDISGLWRAVELQPSDEVSFNRLIQWDDGWLLVVLKKAFLQLPDDGNELLKDKLKELLAGEKHYYSLVKNSEMFNEIEREAVCELKKSINDLRRQLKYIAEQSETPREKDCLSIDPFCDDLNKMFDLVEYYTERTFQEKGFVLGRISRLIFDNYLEEYPFREIVQRSIGEIRDSFRVNDIVVEFKPIKSGIQESLMLYTDNGKKVSFKEVSNTATDLKLQREFVLPFYIYFNPESAADLKYSEMRKAIGKNLGSNIKEIFSEYLNKLSNNFIKENNELCVQ